MNTHMSICRVTENNVIKLLQDGVISCVLSQDWRVNRIVPEFINKANFKSILCKKSKLLHLGIGDGKCSRYFDKVCSQFSISDKLYIDPYDVIFLYLKRCNFDQRQVIFWAEVMRDEYLISVCAKKLYNENKNLLYNKDFIICEMLEQEFCQKNNYSFSYNMLLLLVHILNTNPSLLLPVTSMKRVLTPMGKHIIEKK